MKKYLVALTIFALSSNAYCDFWNDLEKFGDKIDKD